MRLKSFGNKSHNILFVVYFLVLILPLQSFHADGQSDIVEEGLKLVETFYEFLTSDADLKDCPNIFAHFGFVEKDEGKKQESLQRVWKKLRDNKELFTWTFDPSPLSLKDFFSSSKKCFLFYKKPPCDKKFDPNQEIDIVLISKTTRDNNGDMRKEIAFNIMFDKKKGAYGISLFDIRINGIYIDNFEFCENPPCLKRNFDVFKRLGFKKSSSNPIKE